MELSNLLFSFFFFFLFITSGTQGSPDRRHHHHHHHHHRGDHRGFRPTKLFVFGDSYADTGNIRKSLASSWKEPYGITFPRKPSGRFSDGRILTDYLAKFLGLKTPATYAWRKLGGKNLRYGMNFAYGGSGVFDTLGTLLPNMTTQIDFFENLINNGSLYTKWDLQSSTVLISLAGNDYAFYIQTGGTVEGLRSFIPLVVNQLSLNLKRLRDLGARRILVTAMEPLGCLPRSTQNSSFQRCNDTQNLAVSFHNLLLRQAISKLNNDTTKFDSKILILDLYNSFATMLDQKRDTQGKFVTPLKPCCMGTCTGCSCGSVDEKGNKLYTVCSNPESAFFWDSSHPTQAGWNAVFTTFKSSLENFF